MNPSQVPGLKSTYDQKSFKHRNSTISSLLGKRQMYVENLENIEVDFHEGKILNP